MKKNYMYYVVDPIAETIIGSFSAISDKMAKNIVERSLNDEKLKVYKDSCRVYKATGLFEICETFTEVVDACVLFASSDNFDDNLSIDEVK